MYILCVYYNIVKIHNLHDNHNNVIKQNCRNKIQKATKISHNHHEIISLQVSQMNKTTRSIIRKCISKRM